MLPHYHPTSVLLIDDDPSFLDSFRFYLGDRFNCISFQRPTEALEFLKDIGLAAYAVPGFLRQARVSIDQIDYAPGDVVLQLNASTMTGIFNSPKRFRLPSVAVVDYAMPGLTGVEFLKNIRHLPIRRLMLTGRADERTAIEAFNSGIIDGFFMKHEPDLETRLIRKIEQMQTLFFTERTNALKSTLGLALPFLADPALEAPFRDWLRREEVVEYCAQTEPPGVLGLKADGRQVLYVIVDDDFLRASIEIASAEDAPPELLARMQNGTELALFPTGTGFYKAAFASTWQRYMTPATRQLGQRNWHTAFLDSPGRLGFGLAAVASFDAFLDDPAATSAVPDR